VIARSIFKPQFPKALKQIYLAGLLTYSRILNAFPKVIDCQWQKVNIQYVYWSLQLRV